MFYKFNKKEKDDKGIKQNIKLKKIIKENLIAGIARGIGTGIGITLISAIIIMLLKRIILLNIPVIGDYISDIVEIVDKSR